MSDEQPTEGLLFCSKDKANSQGWRIWIVSGTIMVVCFYFSMILGMREYAAFKLSFREYFFVHSDSTNRAIQVFSNSSLTKLFSLYSVIIISSIPILLLKLRWNVFIILGAILIAYSPAIWYGNHRMHLSMKMVDWTEVYSENKQFAPKSSPEVK